MTVLSWACSSVDGPIIDAEVRPHLGRQGILRRMGKQVASFRVRLLVDTGSSHTVLDSSLIMALGVHGTGTADVYTGSTGNTPITTSLFLVSITLDSAQRGRAHTINALLVSTGDYNGRQHQGVLGRDVLRTGAMIYEGDLASVSLAF